METKAARVYADTSVFGGVFDEDFEQASTRFLEQVRRGRFELVSSAVVQAEIALHRMRSRAFSMTS